MFNEIFVLNLVLKCYALKKSDIKCSEVQTFKLDLKGVSKCEMCWHLLKLVFFFCIVEVLEATLIC